MEETVESGAVGVRGVPEVEAGHGQCVSDLSRRRLPPVQVRGEGRGNLPG
jgi:hypothetical protein